MKETEENQYEEYKYFECQECGHKFYSLDKNPECPYCEEKNSLQIEK